jgi:nucleoside-diphosphate-sugar epimerase
MVMTETDITDLEVSMRVFVSGASGFIGSAVVPELINAGHEVLGLARSDEAAAAVAALGADVQRGSLDDLASLRSGAEASEGVIHLAYIHDFADMPGAARADRGAIDVFGEVLEGSDRPLMIASGLLGLAQGRMATERDVPSPGMHPRIASASAALALVERGVRTSIMRFSPSVHGEGDHGFLATLIGIARDKGSAAYIGDGSNCWPGVHRLDAAVLCRLGIEKAPAGSILHAVGDEGVPTREIAEVIGGHLDLPVVSVEAGEQAGEHFGWMGLFFGTDCSASSVATRELLGWEPTHPGLIEDLDLGHYFR